MSSSVDEQQQPTATSKAASEYSANGPSSKHAEYSNNSGGAASTTNNMNNSSAAYIPGPQHQQQGGYMSGSAQQQNLVDAYIPSYYTPYLPYPTPTQTRGPMSGDPSAWSPDPSAMPYMTPGHYAGYGGMYTPFDYAAQHAGYGWFPPSDYGGDWSTGGEGYYAMGAADGYGNTAPPNGDSAELLDKDMMGVERSMNSMGLESGNGRGLEGENGGSYSSRAAAGGASNSSSSGAQKKPTSWAGIASQPASQGGKGQGLIPRAPLPPSKANDFTPWDTRNSRTGGGAARPGGRGRPAVMTSGPYKPGGASEGTTAPRSANANSEPSSLSAGSNNTASNVGEKIGDPATYNPKEFDLSPKGARFFIIKSYSEDDIHRSIKYGIWCSTDYGNKRLDQAFKEREGKGPLFLLYSVNGSGHFCGMAQMMTAVDYSQQSQVWQQNKWKGVFEVKWIYVKDVPNSQLRHIKLENNENKPVTNSRDTQEVLGEKGLQVLRIIHQYRHTTSIFDDFSHYEKRQEEDVREVK